MTLFDGKVVCSICALALMLGPARPASAQIYSWYDSRGMLVLSNVPSSPNARLVYQESGSHRIIAAVPRAVRYRGEYDRHIAESADQHNLDRDLVRSVIQVESGFNPLAVSPKGAQGLMQLMPATASRFGVANVFDPVQNIEGGSRYLRFLLDTFKGDTRLALAAYNAGEKVVAQLQEVPPFRETIDYVRKVTGLAGGTPVLAAGRSLRARSASRSPGGSSISGTAPPGFRPTVIYKYTERVGDREVTHYSDIRPRTGSFQIIRVGS